MQFSSNLKASELKSFLRSMISGINELPEQEYSFGFVIQKAKPSMKISREQTTNELTALLNAINQFTEEEIFTFEIKMPIFSEAEETALNLINAKYKAVKSLNPETPKLVKV